MAKQYRVHYQHHPPVFQGLIVRPRLMKQLTLLSERYRLLIISAPAGFGKTAAVSQWLQASNHSVLWINFCKHYGTTLSSVDELISSVPPFDVVVLDSCHKVNEDHLSGIIQKIRQQVPDLLVIVIGNHRFSQIPESGFMEYQYLLFGAQELTEYEQDRLIPETGLNESVFKSWPALLNLYSNLLATNPNLIQVHQEFATFSEKFIEHELLAPLSEQDQHILLQLSLLPSLEPDSVAFAFRETDFITTLEKLLKLNLLAHTQNSEKLKFIHPWLREHCRHKALIFSQSNYQDFLHHLGQWYIQQEQPVNAIKSFIDAHDWNQAANLIEKHGEEISKRNAWSEVGIWIEKMPKEIVETRPELLMNLTWQSISSMNKPRAARYINRALRETHGHIETRLHIHKLEKIDIQAQLDQLNNLSESLALMLDQKSFEQKAFIRHTVQRYLDTRSALFYFLTAITHYASGELRKANEICVRVIEQAQKEKNATLLINALFIHSQILLQMCRPEALFFEAAEVKYWLLENNFSEHSLFGWCDAVLIPALIDRNQLENAENILMPMLSQLQAEDNRDAIFNYTLLVYGAYFYRSTFDFDRAFSLIERAEGYIPGLPQQIINRFISTHTLKADILISQEKYEDVNLHLQAQNLQEPLEMGDLWMSAQEVFIQSQNADSGLNQLAHLARAQDNFYLALYIDILKSLYLYQTGQYKKAEKQFQAILQIPQIDQYIRLFLNRGKPFGNFLLKLERKGRKSSLLDLLLEKIRTEPYQHQLYYNFIHLSKREVEILSLISQGKTNEEISEILCRSLGTVKLHVHNIYKKLGVNNRMQALQKCQACGFEAELA